MEVASCAYYVSENYVMVNACFASEKPENLAEEERSYETH